jgi:hypothetical protein
VNYVADSQGLIKEVWILTPAEAELKRAGLEVLTNITFESDQARTACHSASAASK